MGHSAVYGRAGQRVPVQAGRDIIGRVRVCRKGGQGGDASHRLCLHLRHRRQGNLCHRHLQRQDIHLHLHLRRQRTGYHHRPVGQHRFVPPLRLHHHRWLLPAHDAPQCGCRTAQGRLLPLRLQLPGGIVHHRGSIVQGWFRRPHDACAPRRHDGKHVYAALED